MKKGRKNSKTTGVTAEIRLKKQVLKDNTRFADGIKRFRIKEKAEMLGGSRWSDLSIKDKEELILNWSVNGGIIAGKRFARKDLCHHLGMSATQLEELIEVSQRSFEKLFEAKERMKSTVYSVAGKVVHQLQDNRARAVQHSDILEEELSIVRAELAEARKKKPKNPTEKLRQEQEISRLMGYFRSISYQKLESMRILLECTEGHNKFLAMFTSQRTGKMPGLGDGEDPVAQPGDDYVNQKNLVALLEDHVKSPLPSHRDLVFDAGPKNPNAGFESFNGKEPDLSDA